MSAASLTRNSKPDRELDSSSLSYGNSVTCEPLTRSVPEAAKLLGIGLSLAWELIRRGELRSVRAGRRVLVSVREIARFLGDLE